LAGTAGIEPAQTWRFKPPLYLLSYVPTLYGRIIHKSHKANSIIRISSTASPTDIIGGNRKRR
jgi:hypothetical protein